ncbi:hypothetical protein HY624_00340 [Candidatus Uhrbacteria bacterium]|nr:hypothetical protein [Candidatus Uhrbacteria bacterium]
MSDPILPMTPVTPEGATPVQPKTITLKIPQLNIQAVILGLLALVTIFQTVQLYTLKSGVATLSIKPAAAAASAPAGGSSAPAAGGSDNGLQGMVGGC